MAGTPEIVIDEGRCKGCGLCIEVCPKGLITLGDGLNHLGYHPAFIIRSDGCTGCGDCMVICPDLAIGVYGKGLNHRE